MEFEALRVFGWNRFEQKQPGGWKVVLLHEQRHLCAIGIAETRELALIKACSKADDVSRVAQRNDERLSVLSAFVFDELRRVAIDPALGFSAQWVTKRIEELNGRK